MEGIIMRNDNKMSFHYDKQHFFREVLDSCTVNKIEKVIVVTHIVPGNEEYLIELNKKIPIIILPKQSSVHKGIKKNIEKLNIPFLNYTRKQISNEKNSFISDIDAFVGKSKFAIIDIGGVFSDILVELYDKFGDNLVGIVEDTENGHQKYIKLLNQSGSFPCPVYSVARSILKEPEDFLIGQSIVFSSEALLREEGKVLTGKCATVLGYGKIGSSIAIHLRSKGLNVKVIDTDPKIQLIAFSNNFYSGSKAELIANSDLIYCATGNKSINIMDINTIKRGAYVFTATSADDEIGDYQQYISYIQPTSNKAISRVETESNYFYLSNRGNSVNFLHGSVVGNFIAPVQAELLFALSLMDGDVKLEEVVQIDNNSKSFIANLWLKYFSKNKVHH